MDKCWFFYYALEGNFGCFFYLKTAAKRVHSKNLEKKKGESDWEPDNIIMQELVKSVMERLEESRNLVLNQSSNAQNFFGSNLSAKMEAEERIAKDLPLIKSNNNSISRFTFHYFKELFKPVKKLILTLCENESFAKKYLDDKKSLIECVLLISEELGKQETRGLSDLEIYKKAISYFVPGGEIKAEISVELEDNMVEDCIDGAHPTESFEFNKPEAKSAKKKIPENIRKKKLPQNNTETKENTVQVSLFGLL